MIFICTSVIAGKNATADHVIIVSRNEDYTQNNWNKYLKYRHKSQYQQQKANDPSIQEWTLGNGLKVPIPKKSFSYNAIPDAAAKTEAQAPIGDYYYFEERGTNEKNVAISATNSMDANEKALAADPFVKVGLEESILLTLLLPQVETALEAVELLGHYVETFGAMEANGISIADPNEAWYFEIGSGHHWIAVKVPDDCYIGIANCMVVHDVNLNDIENVKYSKDLFTFVHTHHLLEAADEKNFNFAKAFGTPGSMVNNVYEPYYNVDRLWLIQSILTPSLEQAIQKDQYPMFLKPDHPIEVSDIMKVLRSNYKNTPLESSAKRPIGVVRTAESHIIVIDASMPTQLQCVIWQTLSSPLGTSYMPIFSHANPYPEEYACGNSDYSTECAYWNYRGSYTLANSLGADALIDFQNKLKLIEDCLIRQHNFFQTILKLMDSYNPSNAQKLAGQYSLNILDELNIFANTEFNIFITTTAIEQKDIS